MARKTRNRRRPDTAAIPGGFPIVVAFAYGGLSGSQILFTLIGPDGSQINTPAWETQTVVLLSLDDATQPTGVMNFTPLGGTLDLTPAPTGGFQYYLAPWSSFRGPNGEWVAPAYFNVS